jgi:putative nucleotidyltransferase with HDIG domain
MIPRGRADVGVRMEPTKRPRQVEAPGNDVGDLRFVSAKEVSAALRARFGSPNYRPPLLPVVAMEVMSLSHQRDASADALAELLAKDPMLAGRVLHLAQSPVYSGQSPIRSVRQAVVRLGLATMRDVVMEVAMNLRVFRAPGFATALEQLRRHSTTVAYLARAVCRFATLESELAFLCGLLHDVGIAASLVVLAEDPELRSIGVDHVLTAVDEVHCEATGQLARLWKLPAETHLVLERHHTLRIDGHVHPLIAVLAVAEELAVEAGGAVALTGASGTRFLLDQDGPARLTTASEALRLNDKMLAELRKEAARMFAAATL